MSDSSIAPTHFRLLAKFKMVGPYLRESESQDGLYLFDCLSVCVDETKSPEEREFWGWWLELSRTDEGFAANYSLGLYNAEGNWEEVPIPENVQAEISRTQEIFQGKLDDSLNEHFELSVSMHTESSEFV